MLTGVTPEVHGITWNSDKTGEHGVVKVETIFEVAKRNGFSTAAFFSKSKLRHLQRPNSLDYVQAPRGLEVWMASQTVEDATRYLRLRRPNLLFVHIAEPDAAGHSIGWMSFAYRWAVRRADSAVEEVLEAADETYGRGNYTVIVTADHGGHGRGHGDDSEEDMQIPWIAWGAGVEAGEVLEQVNTMDTAATVLWLLGIREPSGLNGVAVAEAYTPLARLAADNAQQLR
jgi:predicted AlkP superfamily pyrophosphatase or phosphodiesterase